MKNFARYLKKENAICKLITDSDSGTGFICQIKIKDKTIKLLFTNNHILNESKIKIGSNIKIKDKNDIKIINNRFVCTNKELDYTCIEIFDNENFKNYFKIDPDINCDNPFEEYKDDLIVVMQYPKNKSLSVAEGYIKEFKDDNTYIIHSVSTDNGSSGSPIILSNRNLNIIGIHLGRVKYNYKKVDFKKGVYFIFNGEVYFNKAVYFKIVLKDIKKQYSNFIQKNSNIKHIGTYEYYGKNYDKYSLGQFEENNEK